MTANELRAVINFEKGLVPGVSVRVRWTNSNRYLAAQAVVLRVNRKSVRVTLTEAVATIPLGGWQVGHEIVVPRIDDKRWSCGNRAEPVDGYK